MVHSFKGIRDTFEYFELNFWDIRKQRFLDFGDICSKCCMILGYFSKYFQGYCGPPFQGLKSMHSLS